MRFICKLCSPAEYSTLSYNRLLRHYSTNHVSLKVNCGVNECKKRLRNVRSIKNHIKRFHLALHLQHVAVVTKNNLLDEDSVEQSNEQSFCEEDEGGIINIPMADIDCNTDHSLIIITQLLILKMSWHIYS